VSDGFAEVAVNAAHPARTTFTYAIPGGMSVEAGLAVYVPFGARVLQGIVTALASSSAVEHIREIAAVADPEPILDEAHIALARWLSDTYLAPLWDCIAACLPSGFGERSVTMVAPVDVPLLFPPNPRDQKILQHLAAHGRVSVDALREAVGQVPLARLKALQEQGYLSVAEGLARPAGHAKFERRVALARPAEEAVERAAELESKSARSVAARVLRLLAGRPDVLLAEVRAAGAAPGHLRGLATDGWINAYEARVERDPLAGRAYSVAPPLVLTAEQQAIANFIATNPCVHLIHGVTGSGKTEVYLDLVRRTLDAGKGAIVLVPEIALTPQAIRRYGERFGETLTVLHSGLGAGELYDQWFRIKAGGARLVVGSRSAVFAPVRDLGLIVLDEEHEWTYKQTDPQPRYHARDVALELRRLTGATVVLGSATPDVVTYHRTETGEAMLSELHERVAPTGDGSTVPGALPDISVVDMREELKAGNRSMFSQPLRRAVQAALAAGEQAILFVNRRGSARFVLCRDCGHVPTCPSCEVAVSLDLNDPSRPMLACHHCGRSRKLENRCPRCASPRYRPFGVGTQRVEQEARREFGGARVARWDSDTARQKGSHERIVDALEAGAIDIVVGTQMLAKGLDLPMLTVVGVVDADVGLSLPDYHAHERAYQLLSQVAGRAGRRDRPGRVFIQTYDPDAPPIPAAAGHDYRSFYEHELAHRRRAGYPPFARLLRLTHRNANYEAGIAEASRVATELRLLRDSAGRAEPDVLGPTPAYIARIRGHFRWQILLRGRQPAELVAMVRLGDRWAVDVDPASLL
jgi:primosomal protein N' (replication factor Y)